MNKQKRVLKGAYDWYYSTGMMKRHEYPHMNTRDFVEFLTETCKRMIMDLNIKIGEEIKVKYKENSGSRNYKGVYLGSGDLSTRISINQGKREKIMECSHIEEIEVL